MSNIYLDKDDVRAIAAQREYDVPKKTFMQRLAEWGTIIIAILFTITGIAMAEMSQAGVFQGGWSTAAGACILAAVVFGVIWVYVTYMNRASWRMGVRAFIEHWEKTGEIKPRWPGRLKKNQPDSDRPYRTPQDGQGAG